MGDIVDIFEKHGKKSLEGGGVEKMWIRVKEQYVQASHVPVVRILYDTGFQYGFMKLTSFVSTSQLSCITWNKEDYSLRICRIWWSSDDVIFLDF